MLVIYIKKVSANNSRSAEVKLTAVDEIIIAIAEVFNLTKSVPVIL